MAAYGEGALGGADALGVFALVRIEIELDA